MGIVECQRNGAKVLLLENDFISTTVIPCLGGKIASLIEKSTGFELVAQPRENYKRPTYGSDFSCFDASGLDDGFPCLHACNDSVSGWIYPDHGEIWSAELDTHISGDCIQLKYESPYYPYQYQKNIIISRNRLILEYHIENNSSRSFPCIWAFHGLFRYENDMEIIYPPDCETIINTLESPMLGQIGQLHNFNGTHDFSHPSVLESPTMVKYYLAEPVKEGRCGYWYPSANIGCFLHYDPNILPYLGVWITSGGYRGEYNCALEPCNGFYDDIITARNNNALYILEQKLPLVFNMTLEVTNKLL